MKQIVQPLVPKLLTWDWSSGGEHPREGKNA
jgi:hypothetical protein